MVSGVSSDSADSVSGRWMTHPVLRQEIAGLIAIQLGHAFGCEALERAHSDQPVSVHFVPTSLSDGLEIRNERFDPR